MGSLIEKVKNQLDIVELIGQHVQLKKQSNNYVGLCPFHDDHSPSFSVSVQKQIYKCFSCNNGGDVISFYQKINHLPKYRDALFKLAATYNIVTNEPSVQQYQYTKQLQCNELCQNYWKNTLVSKEGQTAFAYLQKRGLTVETINRYNLGYAHDATSILAYLKRCGYDEVWLEKEGYLNKKNTFFFTKRIMFPITDQRGVVGFSGRVLTNVTKYKYLLSVEKPWFQKNQLFYGITQAQEAIQQYKKVILVEGQMDAISLSQCGFPYALALMGLNLTKAHLRLLCAWKSTVILYLDNDTQGMIAGYKMVAACLKVKLDVRIVVNETTKDASALLAEQKTDVLKAQLQDPKPALLFLIERLKLDVPAEELIAEVRKLLELIQTHHDSVAQQAYIKQLANKTKLNFDYLPTEQTATKKEIKKLLPSKCDKIIMQMIVFLLLKNQSYQLPSSIATILKPPFVEMIEWVQNFYATHQNTKKVPLAQFEQFCRQTTERQKAWINIQFFWNHALLTSKQNQPLLYYQNQLHQIVLLHMQRRKHAHKIVLDEKIDQAKIIEYSNDIVGYHQKRKELNNE